MHNISKSTPISTFPPQQHTCTLFSTFLAHSLAFLDVRSLKKKKNINVRSHRSKSMWDHKHKHIWKIFHNSITVFCRDNLIVAFRGQKEVFVVCSPPFYLYFDYQFQYAKMAPGGGVGRGHPTGAEVSKLHISSNKKKKKSQAFRLATFAEEHLFFFCLGISFRKAPMFCFLDP